MRKIRESLKARIIFKRIVICLAVLLAGLVGMIALAALKTPPAEIKPQERALKVEALRAVLEDVPVMIAGYGEVRPLDEVKIASEVAGSVVTVHPKLEAGEVIPAGEVLFTIDNRNYMAAMKGAEANVEQLKHTIQRLELQQKLDGERLKILERNRDLANAEYKRLGELYEKHSVGTRSGVEAAERAYNIAVDAVDQMAQAVAIYPIRIKETRSALAGAVSGLERARADVKRCRVSVNFEARVKTAAVEIGQYVAPGQMLISLADDRVMEIQVPLDSLDVRRWLRFNGKSSAEDTAWFGALADEKVRIRWTEDPENHAWFGRLDRVVSFDAKTRTLTVAVQVSAAQALSTGPDSLPLVEGMFCRVEIPGKSIRGVFRVPRWAVSFQNTIYISKDNRLKTVPVEVTRIEEDMAFISGGIEEGDIIVTTRLVDPLENSLLEITNLGKGAEAP